MHEGPQPQGSFIPHRTANLLNDFLHHRCSVLGPSYHTSRLRIGCTFQLFIGE